MRYIDLMGGQKPHLLIHTTNNMGAETDVQYKASTKFYLQDREAGRPWVTRLPFPSMSSSGPRAAISSLTPNSSAPIAIVMAIMMGLSASSRIRLC